MTVTNTCVGKACVHPAHINRAEICNQQPSSLRLFRSTFASFVSRLSRLHHAAPRFVSNAPARIYVRT